MFTKAMRTVQVNSQSQFIPFDDYFLVRLFVLTSFKAVTDSFQPELCTYKGLKGIFIFS